MESPPSLDTVYQGVFALYNNTDTADKEKASQWLGELQKSVFSWKIADELLQQKRNIESCYFAAQTMRSKIQLSFHELPPEAHISLRDSLMNHIAQVTEETNAVIVTQLCLALADLALQMSSWKCPVVDLIAEYSGRNVWPLLLIMTVIPEEINSRSLRLGANRRKEIITELNNSSQTVNEYLKLCMTTNADNTQVLSRILRCFTSWISIHAISLAEVSNNVIVARSFQILNNYTTVSMLHDAATEVVCTLLQCLNDNNNQHELEVQLFTGVLGLEDSYHMSVAHEDLDKSLNYCRIFTELAESFLDKIITGSTDPSNPHFAIKILDLVLICVGHHDYEVAEITFNLWYRLSEDLYQRNNESLTSVFKPYVERLIGALCRHCQIEPDQEGLLEEGDDFQDFRSKVLELIKDVVFIVGSSNCFRQMFISLQAPGVSWDSSEAALYVMQAVAKNILPEENEVVPKVVEAILSLPENTHIAVRYTSLLLLGELCEWIDKHPQSLEPVLNFLLYCLQQAGLATAAATALQSICTESRDHMGVHFSGLIQIVQSLDSFQINNESAIGLLKGVSATLSRLPKDQIPDAMKQICLTQVTPLNTLLDNNVPIEKGTKSDPGIWLDRLAAIFRYTNPEVKNDEIHPCLTVITEIWPVLSKTCDKYQSDLRIMERCCRCVRFVVRCVGKQSAHLLESLVKQIVVLYSLHTHSCFLYLGSILVDEYADELPCAQGLIDMLQAFIQPTFSILEIENGLKNHPDTVDDFFRLCTRFLQRSPILFLQSPALNPIVRCGLLATTLDHRDANASVMKFFTDLIYIGRTHHKPDLEARRNLVQVILTEHGQALVNNLIQGSLFCLHSYMLTDVAQVFMELVSIDRTAIDIWLKETLQALPKQNSAGIINATPQQLFDFHNTVIRADSTKTITIALRDFSRLYR